MKYLPSNLSKIPKAPGLYRPEIEDGNPDDTPPGWGISMQAKKGLVYLLRFEMTRTEASQGR